METWRYPEDAVYFTAPSGVINMPVGEQEVS
jgi:hypothetical protein